MRILVEPSGYPSPLRNVGDIAMQRTALTRLAQAWPGATIEVLSDSPEHFPFYAENVKPLSTLGRRLWLSGPMRNRRVPEWLQRWGNNLLWSYPEVRQQVSKFRLHALPSHYSKAVTSFLHTMSDVDVLVVCGMGGVTDAFELYALDLLETINKVKENGKSIVLMLGQAFGPIAEGTVLYEAARKTLPAIDFIGLRESRASEPLLKALGVDPSRVMVTGDDALEIAVQNRLNESGNGIGVNVRVAPYSEVNRKDIESLGSVLQRISAQRSVDLIPIPCSTYSEEDDSAFIQLAVNRSIKTQTPDLVTPEYMIGQLQRCRVAVLGSYHAAVFALAQGIPVVGIYRSPYYRDKFLGLAHMFGPGVVPINLAEEDWTSSLESKVFALQQVAPDLRQELHGIADELLRTGRETFRQITAIVNKRLCFSEALPG